MSTVVSCQCGQQFEAADFLAGRVVPCPACGQSLTVPAIEEEIVELHAAEPITRISVACQCGKRFKALPKLLGTVIPCPACGNNLRVKPAPPQLTPLPSLVPTAFDSSLGNFGGGLGQAMPMEQYSTPYPGQYSYSDMGESQPRGRTTYVDVSPQTMKVILFCVAGLVVLVLLAMIIPPVFHAVMADTNVASNSPAPSSAKAPSANAPAANAPIASAPAASAAPANAPSPPRQSPAAPAPKTNSTASSSGNWWNPFSWTPKKNWAIYNASNSPVSVEFPGTPITGPKAQAAFGAGPGIENPAVLTLSDGNEFGIGGVRFPVEVNDENVRRVALNEFLSEMRKDPSMQVTSHREIMLGGHPGLEMNLIHTKSRRKYEGCMRVYATRRYLCLGVVGGPIKKFNVADGNRFLDSMKITVN